MKSAPRPPRKPKKPPIVRRGQKKPYSRATDEVIDQRVQIIADLLAQHAKRTHIIRAVREMAKKDAAMWDLDFRTIDVYISRARVIVEKASDTTRDQARAKAVAFYEQFINSAKGTPRDRIAAQQRLDEIFGIDAPKQVRTELSGPEGGPIATKQENPLAGLSIERLRELAIGHLNGEPETNKSGNGR